MTREHRLWHFWAWVVLAPVIALVLVAALVGRPEAAP